MTRTVHPRALVHCGHHLASGLLLQGDGDRLRAQALALWTPGTRIVAVEGGLWVRFPQPRPVDAGRAPGALVIREDGVELAAPLTSKERAALAPPPGALVVVRGGVARVLPAGAEVDPSRWLELAPRQVQLAPLGAPPAPPADPPAARDVRGVLSAPAAAPELAAVVAALTRAAARGEGTGGAGARAAGPGWPGLLVLISPLLRWLARSRGTPASRGASGARALPAAAVAARLRGPGFLRRLLERLALLSGVAQLAGGRQAAYLRRLLELFDRGELEEALRHAIPLGRPGEPPGALSFGLPAPRRELAISPQQRGGSSTLLSGPDLHGYLRQLYRSTFDRLHAAGRFQEAAFVLAELLKADEEAVSYLERQGELRLAAELAEGRGLSPGLAIRQWFLARDTARAVAVARRTGAYGDAVDRLARSGRGDEAAALRLVWAEDLAEAGDLEGAVAAVKDVPAAQALRRAWMERAIASGGLAGDALLFPWVAASADGFEAARSHVREACARPAPDGPFRRAALVRGLLGVGRTPETAELARPVLRAVLRDRHAGEPALAAVELKRLLASAADGALDQDLPPEGRAPTPSPGPLRFTVAADDRGVRAALDAAALPDGRALVAYGEGGAALLGRDGHTVARLDAPAHQLVVSDLGTRALALAPRGEAIRVSWLDLDARTVKHLGDLRLDAFAPSFDGVSWAVATGADVRLLDVLGGLRTLWRVPDSGPFPRHLARVAGALAFVTGVPGAELEGWRYELRGLVLRARTPLAPGEPAALGPDGRWLALCQEGGDVYLTGPVESRGKAPLRLGSGDPVALAADAALAAAVRTPSGVSLLMLDREDRTLATLELAAARTATVRLQGHRLTVADDQGRVVAVDLAARRVTHDLRM